MSTAPNEQKSPQRAPDERKGCGTGGTPREVFARLLDGITAGRREELVALYAPDAVVDVPFALPVPVRLRGREELRGHFTAARSGPAERMEMTARNVVVHETADPELIIAEFDYHLRLPDTGVELDVANIQTVRVRDGLIVATRDFHNHAALAAALG
jgi:uncharacterized protein